MLAFIFLRSLVVSLFRWLVIPRIGAIKTLLLPLSLRRFPLRPEVADDFPRRVLDLDWSKLEAVYGSADRYQVPLHLITLAQNRDFTHASGELRIHLSHQDSFLTSASAAALPFYLELSRCRDDELVADILYKLETFAFCTNPNHPSNADRETFEEFESKIYTALTENIPYFQTLSKSTSGDVGYAATSVIESLTKAENAV